MFGHLLTQAGDSSSGLSALGINLQAFIIQLITFLLAFLALRQWAFKPILRVLRERRETIDKGVKLGEQMQREEAALQEKVNSELHKARQQADDLLSQAEDQSRQIVHTAEEKARQKAATVVAEAEERIAQDTTRARRQLEHDIVGLVAEATEAIVQEKVDPKKDAALIDRALREYSRT